MKLPNISPRLPLEVTLSRLDTRPESTLDTFDDDGFWLPSKTSLNEHDRLEISALCMIRATESEPPMLPPKGRWTEFKLLHHKLYRRFLLIAVLFHVLLASQEHPPVLQDAGSEELSSHGYWSSNLTITLDLVLCFIYNFHCFLVLRVEQWTGLRQSLKLMFCVVFLLNVDAILGAGFDSVRPFRCLRPLVFTLVSVQQTTMVVCCARTLVSLSHTFLLLVLAIGIYAVIGLTLFSGFAPDDTGDQGNALGAACWRKTEEMHPFRNFGAAVLNMYVLATSENFPGIIMPFFTCSCEYTARGETDVSLLWKTDHCALRQYTSALFFGSFIVIVFFFVGNSVLGVCYYWFERVMKDRVTVSAVQQRFNLVAAFYYLEQNGTVSPESFAACVKHMRDLCPGMPGTVEGDWLFFRFLDRNNSNSLSLGEFFKLPELMRSNIGFHKENNHFESYGRWKESAARNALVRLVELNYRGYPILEGFVSATVVVNFLLASVEGVRDDEQRVYANISTALLFFEAFSKISGYGLKTYLAYFWNKVDVMILLTSIGAVVADFSTDGDDITTQNCIDAFRMLRFLRFVRLLGTTGKTDTTGAKFEGFGSRLMESLATTMPVTLDMLLIMFFILYFFAMIGMESFWHLDTNVNEASYEGGLVDFRGNSTALESRDWADAGSAISSVFVVIVGNDWHELMFRGLDAGGGPWLVIFFVMLHFVGVFLLLSIIQSLFVFTFSTFLNPSAFEKTVEYQVRLQLEKLHNLNPTAFKKIHRSPRIEYLLLSWEDLDRSYTTWLESQQENLHLDFGNLRLPLSPLSTFLFTCDRTGLLSPNTQAQQKARERHKSMARNAAVSNFLRDELGAKEAPFMRRMTKMTGDHRTSNFFALPTRNNKNHSVAMRRASAPGPCQNHTGFLQQPANHTMRSSTTDETNQKETRRGLLLDWSPSKWAKRASQMASSHHSSHPVLPQALLVLDGETPRIKDMLTSRPGLSGVVRFSDVVQVWGRGSQSRQFRALNDTLPNRTPTVFASPDLPRRQTSELSDDESNSNDGALSLTPSAEDELLAPAALPKQLSFS